MQTPSKTEARTRIVALLGKSVYHALGLIESLRGEFNMLETQDTEGLVDTTSTKSRCVEKLKQLEEQRSSLCLASGFEGGPAQMEAMTAWCDEDLVVRNCWDHLIEIAGECNALNLTNGAVIRARQQHFQSNLAVLRGADQETDTYQRFGNDPREMNQRSLAEA